MDLDLLLYSLWYPPYTWGGVGTQTYDLAHSLARLGVRVTVICGGSKIETDQRENLNVIRLPTVELQPRFLWFQLRNRNVEIFREKLRYSDILHSQANAFSLYPLLERQRTQPWIVSIHVSPFEEVRVLLNTSPLRWNLGDVFTHVVAFPLWAELSSLELKYADRSIICGYAVANDLSGFFHCDPSKMQVIQNGIDFPKIQKIINDRLSIVENIRPTIFYCGRLYSRKGIEYLVKAMPLLIKEHKNVLLKIFGKGPLKSYILRLISSLHLENNVELVGYASYERLIKELNAASIAVFPSLYEGLSVAMLEAMACSKPIVAFDFPFTREIVENMETGVLIAPKDISKLSEAISFLLDNERSRRKIGASAYSYVKKNHDWNVIAEQYVKTYKNTLANF